MKKQFNFLIYLILSSIIISTPLSCSKKSTSSDPVVTSEYFIRFKIDGIQKEFKANIRASISDISTVSTTIFLGAFSGLLVNTTNTNSNLMSVGVRDPFMITTNKVYNSTYPPSLYQVSLLYWDENGNQYSSQFLSSLSNTDAVVTFSEVTDKIVSGNFSGKIALSGNPSNTHLVTEGVFKMKLD